MFRLGGARRVGAVLFFALVGLSCSSGSGDGSTTVLTEALGDDSSGQSPEVEATTTTATEPPLEESPEVAVEATYRDYVAATIATRRSPDPNDPRIAQYSAGRVLDGWRDRLAELKGAGQYVDLSIDLRSVDVTQVSAEAATVRSCWIETAFVLDQATDTATGAAISAGEDVDLTVEMAIEDETWKIEGLTHNQDQRCDQ